jgi:ABC-type glycerol-3-phosphate transport system permease component
LPADYFGIYLLVRQRALVYYERVIRDDMAPTPTPPSLADVTLAWYARHGCCCCGPPCLFPIFWMVSTSFKDAGEWIAWPPHWLPQQPTLHNYEQILAFTPPGVGSDSSARHAFTIWKAVGDSLFLATGSSLVALFMGTFLAYAISRFQVGGKNFRYAVLTIRMVPPIVIAIPILMYYAILIPYTTEALFGVRLSLFGTKSDWACSTWRRPALSSG